MVTSAATTLLDPTVINGIKYVGGAFGNHNPSTPIPNKLKSIQWFSRMNDAVKEVSCFVSIGTGLPTFNCDRETVIHNLKPRGWISLSETASLCISIATHCHWEHLKVEKPYVPQANP